VVVLAVEVVVGVLVVLEADLDPGGERAAVDDVGGDHGGGELGACCRAGWRR
jgi:hypothetical protein